MYTDTPARAGLLRVSSPAFPRLCKYLLPELLDFGGLGDHGQVGYCFVSLFWLRKREDTGIHLRGAAPGGLVIFVFPGL